MSQARGTEPEKRRNRRRRSIDDLDLPDEVRQAFDDAVSQAAGKPLSMTPGSPLGKLIGVFVEQCMDAELREHLGYERYERQSPSQSKDESRRTNTRNGYSSKRLKTSLGTTPINVPRDRQGEFEPRIVGKNQTLSEQIEHRIINMYAHGMTTRDIAQHARELYGIDASEDFVSRIVEQIEPELNAWRNRPLEEIYAIVYVDAVHLKIRHAAGVRSTAVYIVSGYGEDGTHDILGIWIAESTVNGVPGESASYWQSIFVELNNRGLKQALIVSSDGLSGLVEALESVYPRARHSPCVVHLVRASLRHVSYQERRPVTGALKRIYQAPSYEGAEAALLELEQAYKARYPAIVTQWRTNLVDLAALWTYSDGLRRLVYTINPQENINRQVRKLTRNRGAMPSVASAMRLLTLIVRDIHQRAASRSHRPDWTRIVKELHIHFSDILPSDWGYRS